MIKKLFLGCMGCCFMPLLACIIPAVFSLIIGVNSLGKLISGVDTTIRPVMEQINLEGIWDRVVGVTSIISQGQNALSGFAIGCPSIPMSGSVFAKIDYAHIREQPNTDSTILASVSKGATLSTQETWVHVKIGSVDGWIRADVVTPC